MRRMGGGIFTGRIATYFSSGANGPEWIRAGGTLIACTAAMTSMKVLIVDDNQLLCLGLGRMLSRLDLFHRAVEDGANALAEVRATFYDLVFLDIRLPDANGLDLMKELRWISPGTKFVIISSDGSAMNVQRALSEGALRFLHKPFDRSEFEEALEAALPCLRRPTRVADGKVEPTPTRISVSGTEESDT